MICRCSLLLAAAILVAGSLALETDSTFSAIQVWPTKSLRDKPGDPRDGNYKRYPNRRDLDIRLVQVTKLRQGLRVVVQTEARARRANIYSFYYYRPDDNGGGLIQVRYRPSGALTADANIEPSQQVLKLPAGSAQLRSNALVLTAPNRYLDRVKRFQWRVATAYSITDALEVSDDAPDQRSILNVKLASYP